MPDGSNLDIVNAAEIMESLSDKPDQLKKACNALNDDILAAVLEASLYTGEEIDPKNYNQNINFSLDPVDIEEHIMKEGDVLESIIPGG